MLLFFIKRNIETYKTDLFLAQGVQDLGRSYIQLSRDFLICMLLCVESFAGHGFTECSVD